jgi:ATP-dependent RNA helicase RhlE
VGDAFTFVAPEEEEDLRRIERTTGKRLPRVIVPDFDYRARAGTRLEIPIAERICAIRAKRAEDRARAEAKTKRRLRSNPNRERPA